MKKEPVAENNKPPQQQQAKGPFGQGPPEPVTSLRLIVILACLLIKFIFAPFTIMAVCLMFGNTFTTIQKHALVLNTCLGPNAAPYVFGMIYKSCDGELATAQVFGSFVPADRKSVV